MIMLLEIDRIFIKLDTFVLHPPASLLLYLVPGSLSQKCASGTKLELGYYIGKHHLPWLPGPGEHDILGRGCNTMDLLRSEKGSWGS